MGLQRQVESLRLKGAVAFGGCGWHWHYGCGWEESTTTQHNTTQQRSNIDSRKLQRDLLCVLAGLIETQVGGVACKNYSRNHANRQTKWQIRTTDGGRGIIHFFIFQEGITGVFCGAWFYWSHWKFCIKSKVGNKKWNWQTFTLICLRMKWFDGSEQWNDTKSGEENNTVKEYFQWHSGDSRHGTGTVGIQCRGGKLILV